MSNYRRCYVPGGSYFFTVVTEWRAAILANDLARYCLRAAIRHCQQQPRRVRTAYLLKCLIHTKRLINGTHRVPFEMPNPYETLNQWYAMRTLRGGDV